MTQQLPKRLIEVDLPIKRISAHARREKSIRFGHLSTLHLWWARRPLAACRAVTCAALWPDPVDKNCPAEFRAIAADLMFKWGRDNAARGSEESAPTWTLIRQHTSAFALCNHPTTLRQALLDFIADFANWDNSTNKDYLETARALTAASHWALNLPAPVEERPLGWPGVTDWAEQVAQLLKEAASNPRPIVIDPFAGGGSIPLEALRVGADAFASDLNPIPVLLNKIVLEYVPKHGRRLADEVRKWGDWMEREAETALNEYYPDDADGATPIAYLWSRTIQCEGPGCGAEVPLIRSLWLSKKTNRPVALQLVPKPRAKRVDFKIIEKLSNGWVNQDDHEETIATPQFDGTVKRGSASCPCCGFTTPVGNVSEQLKRRRGGADDARLFCVVTSKAGDEGRCYRLPNERDERALGKAKAALVAKIAKHTGPLSLVPDEPLPPRGTLGFRVQRYGIEKWGDAFSTRQQLTLVTLIELVERAAKKIAVESDPALSEPVQAVLGLAVSRFTDIFNSLCHWEVTKTQVRHLFGRQAVPMIWDFAETNALADAAGNYQVTLGTMVRVLEATVFSTEPGQVVQASATKQTLPDDSAAAVVTDPPYYDAVPYADLSDFFYVWLKRSMPASVRSTFVDALTPKADECIVDEIKGKDRAYFERSMQQAMAESRRVLAPTGIGVVVFAHKSTSGWEAQLQAMCDAGWIMTGSWPIDTELGNRLRAQDSAALASSVHLVCRPRELADGALRSGDIGDWRDVLEELPRRIHDWMPRLAAEGVVGADAIFACLGPALEIFSRYSRVEKASGEQVTLREYLEHIWAAVSKEALSSLITDTDLSSLEADARITAMWLWTLTGGQATSEDAEAESDDAAEDDEEGGAKASAKGGFGLEYDAARKIAQGLGAALEDLKAVVEVKGDKARLLPVAERTAYLFGKDQASAPDAPATARKKKPKQMNFLADLTGEDAAATEAAWEEKTVSKPGVTVLDRVHQSMILFAAGRGEALKRFLVEDGIGREGNFWKLAQALSALYPSGSQEKRWVDGVLARKKGLGL